jgi:vesicle coat complex subunit
MVALLILLLIFVGIYFCLGTLIDDATAEYNDRMKELNDLEKKEYVYGRLSEEEKARLWDLRSFRNKVPSSAQQARDLMAYTAWWRYMSDNKK